MPEKIEMTEEEIDNMTEAQVQELQDKGEIDIPDTTSEVQPPPVDEEGDTPPPGEPKGEDVPSQDDSAGIKRQLDEIRQENERLRRESDGRLRELIESRQRAKTVETTKPDTPQSPFADLLKDIGDDDIVEGARLKKLAQRMEEYIGTKETDFNTAVEKKVQQMEHQRRLNTFEESRQRAEKAHTDYKQVVDGFFKELSPLEASLINQQLYKSQDPAEEVYKTAKRMQTLKQGEQVQNAAIVRKPAPKILGSGGGGGTTPKLTPEKLLSMSDAELAKMDKEQPELLRQMHKDLGET